MITARHNWFLYPFFSFYTLLKIKLSFRKVIICGEFTDRGAPLLIIANHTGWWDGFWVMYLNLKRLKRIFWFMMDEGQLKKYRFFSYTGGYSVRRGSREVIESLRYSIRLLSDSSNAVLLFPQGRLSSQHSYEFEFQKGVDYILREAGENVQVLMVANLVEYFDKPAPSLYIHVRELDRSDPEASPGKSYNDFYRQCVEENTKMAEG